MCEQRIARAGDVINSPADLEHGLFSSLEQIAIEIGWADGGARFRHSRVGAALWRLLPTRSYRPLASPSLEALRAHAEHSRIAARRHLSVPIEPLLKVGYSPEQVATLGLILGGARCTAQKGLPA